MWNINSPKFMESGCGRNEYFSGGIAWATATDNLASAAKCLEYSPEASGGAAAASAARSKIGIRTIRAMTGRNFIRPPYEMAFGQRADPRRSQVLLASLLARWRDDALKAHVNHSVPVMLPGMTRMESEDYE